MTAMLFTVGSDLRIAALRFAASMSEIVYRPSNPYYNLMLLYATMSNSEQGLLTKVPFESYHKFVEDRLEPNRNLELYTQQDRQAANIFLLRDDRVSYFESQPSSLKTTG
jgi:hypothetical protein